MSEENSKPPKSFYWTAGIALVWNLMGMSAYVAQVTMTPDAMSALPEAERMLYENVPSWATSAFAIAVTAGTLGCVLLLMRKALAMPVFIASLLGVLAQNYNSFVLMDTMSVLGAVAAIFSAAVTIIGAYLIWFTSDSKKNGWLS
jgi:hypothetical protein|tara:strand:- start:2069 stop:2503 length:435 start_codon:yes stop_codon:yes gene_type:complete